MNEKLQMLHDEIEEKENLIHTLKCELEGTSLDESEVLNIETDIEYLESELEDLKDEYSRKIGVL